MYQGKRTNKASQVGKKPLILAAAMVAAIGITIAGALAYFTDTTPGIVNLFTPTQVKTQVNETFTNNVKSNVKIQNTGTIDGWIRAKVVITWQDANGNVYSQLPEAGKDYTIAYNSTDWLKGSDGFWYYPTPVAPNGETGVLITSCSLTDEPTTPDGYALCVEILSSGLQSKPAAVFTENWGTSSGLKVSGTPDTDGYKLEKKGGA